LPAWQRGKPFSRSEKDALPGNHSGLSRVTSPSNGGKVMTRIVLAGALAAALCGSAYAQTAEFYVVQDTTTKKCTIVDKKPTATTTVVVGDGKVFKTRTEAETGMKSIKVCTSN
jgi:hypothetical protein